MTKQKQSVKYKVNQVKQSRQKYKLTEAESKVLVKESVRSPVQSQVKKYNSLISSPKNFILNTVKQLFVQVELI